MHIPDLMLLFIDHKWISGNMGQAPKSAIVIVTVAFPTLSSLFYMCSFMFGGTQCENHWCTWGLENNIGPHFLGTFQLGLTLVLELTVFHYICKAWKEKKEAIPLFENSDIY